MKPAALDTAARNPPLTEALASLAKERESGRPRTIAEQAALVEDGEDLAP